MLTAIIINADFLYVMVGKRECEGFVGGMLMMRLCLGSLLSVEDQIY